ncbi:MAG: deoxyribose-phosphate aldolase [Anaerolineaceae bacterium]|nr:deoxyribose-phosphate aldolase [Anaerolineaceae bacterium]
MNEDRTNQTREHVESFNNQELKTVYDEGGKIIRVEKKSSGLNEGKLSKLAPIIDHTLLKADATGEQIDKLCREALEYGFGAVCVNSYWVKRCREALQGSSVKVASVVGFPLGAMSKKAKREETEKAVKDGAAEIDMVINIGELKAGNLLAVARDINGVVSEAHKTGAIVKVIIETCLLSEEEKINACLIAKEAGADFVKTSTGFSTGGATVEDVALMRAVVGENMGVKASGGIRNYADALKMIEAGASRIGASSGIAIVEEELKQ